MSMVNSIPKKAIYIWKEKEERKKIIQALVFDFKWIFDSPKLYTMVSQMEKKNLWEWCPLSPSDVYLNGLFIQSAMYWLHYVEHYVM